MPKSAKARSRPISSNSDPAFEFSTRSKTACLFWWPAPLAGALGDRHVELVRLGDAPDFGEGVLFAARLAGLQNPARLVDQIAQFLIGLRFQDRRSIRPLSKILS